MTIEASTSIVDDDILCRRCSYNLRGLDENGRCPECGTPVGLSLRGNLLRFADPQWLGKLALGLRVMIAGSIVYLAAYVVAFVLRASVSLGGPLLYLVASLVTLAGVWLVTEPDPAALSEAEHLTSRRFIRIALLIGLGHRIFVMGANSLAVSPEMKMAITVLATVAGLVSVAGGVATYQYLAGIAARIPRDGLATTARRLMFAHGICGFVLLALSTAFRIWYTPAKARGLSSWLLGYVYTSMALSLVSMIISIISVYLYVRLGRAVRQQLAASRATWAAVMDSKNAGPP